MFFDLSRFGENVVFLFEDESSVSYRELDFLVNAFVRRFTLGRGLLLLEADNSLNTIVAYLAALKAKCPVALIEFSIEGKNTQLKNTFSFLYHYSPTFDFLHISKENVGIKFDPNLAILLSTSGSTGASKYVCLSEKNILANALSIAKYLDLSTKDRAPTNLPFYYSYGFSVINSHLIVGGSIFITKMSVMDEAFWKLFDDFKCTSFAGVPHTYEMLNKLNISTAERSSLRYATQAGGKLSRVLTLKNAQNAQKEGWKFYVMYGQTEASPRMSYLPPDKTLEYPECIGVPIPGGTFIIKDDNGKIIEEPDVTGELIYEGPNVMMGYACCDEDLCQFKKIKQLKTGDMACRNSAGLYYIIGRKSRFLKLYGLRVGLDEVEGYFLKQGIKVVCGGNDETLCILTVDDLDEEQTRSNVAGWLGIPVFSVQVIRSEYIPLKSSGKIDLLEANTIISEKMKTHKDKLSQHEVDPDNVVDEHSLDANTSNEQIVASIYSEAIGADQVDYSSTLRTIGADSLSIVYVRIELEKHINEFPDNWIDLSVQDLAQLFTKNETSFAERYFRFKKVDSFILLRALAMVSIVSHHYKWFSLPGGATTPLFVIAGYLYLETNREVMFGQDRNVLKLWNGLIVLITTLIPIVLLEAVALTLVGTDWHMTLFFPYENLVYYFNDILGIEETKHHVLWLWFIHAYIQIFTFVAIAFSIKTIRRYLAKDPYTKLLLCFFIFELIGAGFVLIDSYRQDLGHSSALLQHAPTTVLPVVILGALIAMSREKRQIWLCCIAALSYFIFVMFGVFYQGRVALFITIIALLFVKTIRIPAFLIRPVMHLSEASLFIYITHMPIKFAFEKVLGFSVDSIKFVFVAICLSIILWQVWKKYIISCVRKWLTFNNSLL